MSGGGGTGTGDGGGGNWGGGQLALAATVAAVPLAALGVWWWRRRQAELARGRLPQYVVVLPTLGGSTQAASSGEASATNGGLRPGGTRSRIGAMMP